eukprot:403336910
MGGGGYQQQRGGFQGGYQNQYQQQQQPQRQFQGQPQRSFQAFNAQSQPGVVRLVTNDFKITRNKDHGVIYTYSIDFIPGLASSEPTLTESQLQQMQQNAKQQDDSLNKSMSKLSVSTDLTSVVGGSLETFQKFKIMTAIKDKIKQIYGNYIFVGTNMFSSSLVDEQISIETTKPFMGRQYSIIIQRVSEFLFDDLSKTKMEEHPMALNFVNSIIKSGLRNSNLVQIGRNPRFFDPDNIKVHKGAQIWPGFFTSTWIFQQGLYLIIDNISKFLSSDNCKVIIDEMFRNNETEDYISREFEGAVVMVCYGLRRTYKVNRIRWDLNPMTYQFTQGEFGARSTMVDYLQKAYDVRLTYGNQPLLEIKQKRSNIYLPPELCILVGLPPSIKNDKRALIELRQKIFQEPHEKVQNLQYLSRKLSMSKELKDWNLELSVGSDQIDAQILKKPQVYSTIVNKQQFAETNVLRTIVHQPIDLEKWAIFCMEKDVQSAQNIQEKFHQLSRDNNLNIFVDFGDIVAMNNQSTVEDYKDAIRSYFKEYLKFDPAKKTTEPINSNKVQFFLVIIPESAKREKFYVALKNIINSNYPVISQFVTLKTLNSFKDRVYLNILRQINAKLGGDLWRMKFSEDIPERTMVFGIDVCHKGKQSVIGFVATYDRYLCKYYTQASPQPVKGQEIISSGILTEYFAGALEAYKDYNGGLLPEQIFIYRDGVGDGMRQVIIDEELVQLQKVMQDFYRDSETNQVKEPNVTLIFVNKRVRQRFFETNAGQISNPPAGTCIDSGFVEQSEVISGKFDFFLVPHQATQGAVKPTHFYVGHNNSSISKSAIINFTYALCFSYYNWPDSIKVPAPCMLADKIAIYRTEVGNIPSTLDMHRLPFFL